MDPRVNIESWQRGRFDPLEQVMGTSADRHLTAFAELAAWAQERGLRMEETTYVTQRGARRQLHFSQSGDPDVEAMFRISWYAPDQPSPQPKNDSEPDQPAEFLVIMARRPFTCTGCGTAYDPGEMLTMEPPGPVCLACADLDHLEFLPSGNTALTRRSRKASPLSAVVVQWSRTRKRYERQGILADPEAIAQAEAACLDDADVRQRRRIRAALRSAEIDEGFVAELAAAIRTQFPGCPAERADRIAEHAGERGSGRIGRTRAGQALDPEAVRLAVVASVRHQDTPYDTLLGYGMPREEARDRVRAQVDEVLNRWQAAD